MSVFIIQEFLAPDLRQGRSLAHNNEFGLRGILLDSCLEEVDDRPGAEQWLLHNCVVLGLAKGYNDSLVLTAYKVFKRANCTELPQPLRHILLAFFLQHILDYKCLRSEG